MLLRLHLLLLLIQNSNKRANEKSNSMEYWFKTKLNQKIEFVYITAGIVCHINKKATNSFKWTCSVSVYTSWFYLIFMFAIFHIHIRVFIYCGSFLSWPYNMTSLDAFTNTMWKEIFFCQKLKYHRSLIYDFEDGNILIYYIWIPDGHWKIPNTIPAYKTTLTIIHSNCSTFMLIYLELDILYE